MQLRISNIKLGLEQDESEIAGILAKSFCLPLQAVSQFHIIKKSLDARKKAALFFVYTVEVEIAEKLLKGTKRKLPPNVQVIVPEVGQNLLNPGIINLDTPPVVVGAGPAGIFAALTLARHGYKPILLERGKDVAARTEDIKTFWSTGLFDPESNVQFGEGGAGTFSDGKLTTRITDPRIRGILQDMVAAGAPEEILYLHKPHIGTDLLRQVIRNLREKLIELGASVRFQAKVTDVSIRHQKVEAIQVNGQEEIPVSAVILAVGHSARDTYEMLFHRGVPMEAKPFAIGARIEHPQATIDASQYGRWVNHPKLGAADYHLTHNFPEDNRAVYSFCMCPGGQVVAATSEAGGVVTNGMSEYARDTGWANSALVTTVRPDDFGSEHPLAGIAFQRKWEQQAYNIGGCNYSAPAQRVEDFLKDRPTDADSLVLTTGTYRPGVTGANLRECLPEFATDFMAQALQEFERKVSGFADSDALLTGVETRTSAPLRIPRDKNLQALQVQGVFPAGEGAGYAGGIISAAVDGVKVAEQLITTYNRPGK